MDEPQPNGTEPVSAVELWTIGLLVAIGAGVTLWNLLA
jgi:hypothetical protein